MPAGTTQWFVPLSLPLNTRTGSALFELTTIPNADNEERKSRTRLDTLQ
jgi:hypothetical protein